MLPESVLEPVSSVPRLDALGESREDPATWLRELAVVKLNGGLGTGIYFYRLTAGSYSGTRKLLLVK